MKILVLDGNIRPALAITRSLGRAGYELLVGADKAPSLASVSKYCDTSFIYPDPQKRPAEFGKCLIEVVREKRPAVVLPVSEITTLLTMRLKAELEQFSVVPFQDYDSVNRAASKYDVLNLARRLDVPTPKTYFLKNREQLPAALAFFNNTKPPFVLKASRSRVANVDGYRTSAVAYAEDKQAVEKIILNTETSQYPILIQERIHGPGIGLFACYDRGEPVAVFGHRRIREKPPSGGVSVLRQSYPVNETIQSRAHKLLRALNWHGVAMVEFKQDLRNNDYKLMEINGRFWGSLQLAIDAGVDFPLLLVKIAAGEKVAPVRTYNYDTKTRWLWGDIDALLARLFKPEKQLNLPKAFPGKATYLRQFLRFREADMQYELFRREDLKPWLLETYRWFRAYFA